MTKVHLLKRAANKSHIVAGTAAASGLRHNDGKMVGVVFSGEHSLHYLSDDGYRGEAGVVVYKPESGIYGGPVVVIKDDDVVAAAFEHRLEDVEVYRAHLRAEYRVALFLHFARKLGTAVRGAFRSCFYSASVSLLHRRKKTSYPDPCRSEVADLVNFKNGIQLIASLKYLGHLICCHGIKTAAEGVELYELEVVSVPYKLRCGVKP